MNFIQCKLVTIVAEDEIEDRLIEDIKRLGAKGYTVEKVKGEGLHRARVTEWEGGNIKISILVNNVVAERIMQHLAENYFGKFGMTAFVQTAEVLRGEKYN